MARVCDRCKFYDAAGARSECPACRQPLRFTLLAPSGQPAFALPEPAAAPAAPRRFPAAGPGQPFDLLGTLFRYRLLASLVIVPLLLLLSLGFGLNVNFGQPTLRDRYQRLKVGMSIDEVQAVMEPRHSRRFPKPHFSMFDDIADDGEATLVWEENGATVTLTFRDGELVGKSQRGLK